MHCWIIRKYVFSIITLLDKKVSINNLEEHISVVIENPQLWWPNNFGKQPLYNVKVKLRQLLKAVSRQTSILSAYGAVHITRKIISMICVMNMD